MAKKLPDLIGVIHLAPLPGSPGAEGYSYQDALQNAGYLAVKEAKLLQQAGFGGIIIENFGDAPFYKSMVPRETVGAMSIIATAVRESVRIPVGINVLRNDAVSALTIAALSGCEFIRVNVLSGVYATDQGMIQGCAAKLLRERQRMGAKVMILAGRPCETRKMYFLR